VNCQVAILLIALADNNMPVVDLPFWVTLLKHLKLLEDIPSLESFKELLWLLKLLGHLTVKIFHAFLL